MTINVNDVRDLVQELDGVVAVADASMPTLVIDVLRIRRAYGLGPPSALSSYARAIERVEDGDTSDLSSELIIAAAAFCKAELAPRLAEAAIANDVTDVPRLAALLAIQDLERLEQLLTHSHGDELVISTTEAYLALVDARRAIPPELERLQARAHAPGGRPAGCDGLHQRGLLGGYMQVMPFWVRVLAEGAAARADAGKLFHMQTNLFYQVA